MTGHLAIKDGKYYAVINTYVNHKRVKKWISTGLAEKGNKKKAEQFLRDKIKEFELRENITPTDILFTDYVLVWLEKAQIRVDKITYQGYNNVVRCHILPYFNEKKLRLTDVNKNNIQDYVNTKYLSGRADGKGGLSATSIKLHMVLLNQIFNEAIKNDLILKNPCTFVERPKMQRKEPNFYTYSELQNMLTALKNEPLFPLIYFTAMYGLRRSEVLGLKWDSVNFETNILTIKHTVVRYSEIVEKDKTKNNSSFRSYPITEDIKNMLMYLKEKETENRRLFGNEYIKNDYIFKWENGELYKPDYISRKFSQLLEKYELKHIRFHDLRHSCASLLVANGFQLKDIQEWLGHADIQTTANIYAHLDVERKNKIAQSMSNSFVI